MELLVMIVIALVLSLMNSVEVEEVEDVIERETALNPEFIVYEDAFMEVANALGFGTDSSVTCDTDGNMRAESVYSIPATTEDNVFASNRRYRD